MILEPRSAARRPSAARNLLLAACLATGCFVACPDRARAQEEAADSTAAGVAAPPSPADSAAIAKAMRASDRAVAEALGKGGLYDLDRFELGVGFPRDYFDWLATFAYQRRVLTDPRFEHFLRPEASFGKKDYLTEGSVSLAWYLRPKRLWRPEWRIRPVVEGGIGGHIVVQFADITGFNDWSSHARFFVKSRLELGAETDLQGRFGLGVRGRLVVPAHRPLDYAQVFLFLR